MKVPSINKLTDNMVDVGIITSDQLKEAKEKVEQGGGNLGEVLISEGYITEDVFKAFLSKKSDLSYVDLKDYGDIDPKILKQVPEKIARRRNLIPVDKSNNTLTVAIADPINIFAIDDLRAITGMNIEVVLAVKFEIKKAIDKYYGTGFVEQMGQENSGGQAPSEEDIDTSQAYSSILDEIDAGQENEDDNLEVMEKQVGEGGVQDITKIKRQSEGAPVVKMVNFIILNAIKKGASDIHIEPFEKSARIRYRIDGVLHTQPAPPKKIYNALVARIKVMASLDVAEKRRPQDGRIKVKFGNREVDLRTSILPSNFGEKVVLRVLDSSSLCLDLSQLGFEKKDLTKFDKSIHSPNGIILVTGPTGSGKTTTLYSALTTLNQPDVNINTIEDPVEYVLKGIIQIQANPEVGLDFAAGLRSLLRQDPDIIMVGEIRDKETAEIAVNAALTGHLVLATLHTNDAPSAVTRMDNMGIKPFQISSTITMAMAQRLLRTVCPNCKQPYKVNAETLETYGVTREDLEGKKKVTLYKGEGCSHCSGSGYSGRTGVYELMEITEDIQELINRQASSAEIKKIARREGMQTLREAALNKVLEGVTTVDEMLRVTARDAG
ncbi:MAG: type IV-A pilus assembly ATPase PilB [Elusimicrobiota bacterium]